jgi:hypothetical protein
MTSQAIVDLQAWTQTVNAKLQVREGERLMNLAMLMSLIQKRLVKPARKEAKLPRHQEILKDPVHNRPVKQVSKAAKLPRHQEILKDPIQNKPVNQVSKEAKIPRHQETLKDLVHNSPVNRVNRVVAAAGAHHKPQQIYPECC